MTVVRLIFRVPCDMAMRGPCSSVLCDGALFPAHRVDGRRYGGGTGNDFLLYSKFFVILGKVNKTGRSSIMWYSNWLLCYLAMLRSPTIFVSRSESDLVSHASWR